MTQIPTEHLDTKCGRGHIHFYCVCKINLIVFSLLFKKGTIRSPTIFKNGKYSLCNKRNSYMFIEFKKEKKKKTRSKVNHKVSTI